MPSSKQSLLLLHGALGAMDQLKPLAGLLQHKYDVHAMNFSGHGGQPHKGSFSIATFAEEVAAFIDSQKLTSVHIFGYSMGGYVALQLAKTQPKRVGKLVTLATKFNWNPETAAKEVQSLDPDTILSKLPAFAQQLMERHQHAWKILLADTRNMMLEMGATPSLQQQDLMNIHHEVLLLIGDKDKMVTVEETGTAAQALPNSQVKILENTSHPIERVNPEQLAAMIDDFLAGNR